MNLQLWSFHIRDLGVDGLKGLTYSQDQYPAFLRTLVQNTGAEECFYLATCNRVEFLVYGSGNLNAPNLPYQPKIFSDVKSILTHLLEVACSMDSIVFGENQILGQIKNAFTEQQKNKFVGPKIAQVLNLVLREAKVIRTETQLSRLQTSVSSVAAKIIGTNASKQSKVLLVGYGETHKLLHKSLDKKNFKNIAITNRTGSKIPDQESVQKISWMDFNTNHVGQYDVVCFATSSEKPLLTEEFLLKTQARLVIDLCIPPNAEKTLVESKNSKYVGLEEIQKTVQKDIETADTLKRELEGTIFESVEKIFLDLSLLSINNLISANIQKSFEIHNLALAEDLSGHMTNLTSEQKADLAEWSKKLIKKINHIHLKTYKEVVDVVQNKDRHAQK